MSTEVEIRFPAEQTEGTRSQILRWLKSVGESVIENEPLIEIETDKVTVEVASPGSGTLREILKQEQDEIGPGDLLGRIDAAGNGARPGLAESSPAVARAADLNGDDAAAAHLPRGTEGHSAAPSSDASAGPMAGALSPAVRRLLAERGIDAGAVRGTGAGGRVTVEDVLQHKMASGPNGSPEVNVSGASHRVPHTAVRKRIAEHMVQSLLRTAPHVTTVFEADMRAVLEHRRRNKDEFTRPISFRRPWRLSAPFLKLTADGPIPLSKSSIPCTSAWRPPWIPASWCPSSGTCSRATSSGLHKVWRSWYHARGMDACRPLTCVAEPSPFPITV
jgi:2-oxoglutarate dehydrogenase E2 component (dihydrolipoamide succinyltransferase)